LLICSRQVAPHSILLPARRNALLPCQREPDRSSKGQAKGEHLDGWTVLQGLLMFCEPGLDSGFGC